MFDPVGVFRAFLISGLVLFLPFQVFAQTAHKPDVPAIEQSRIEWLISALEERNLPYEQRELFSQYGAFGSSLHVVIRPDTQSDDQPELFILAMPLYSAGDPGSPGRYDMEAALIFAEKTMQSGTNAEIRIAFLGNEYSVLPEDIESSRHEGFEDLLDIYDNPELMNLLYIDIPAETDKLGIHHGSVGNTAPMGILSPFTEACADLDIPYSFVIRYNELYKIGLASGPEVLEISQPRGVPSFFVYGEPLENPVKAIPGDRLGSLLFSYSEKLDTSPSDMDYHYSLLHAFSMTLYFSETLTVLSFLALLGISLFVFLIYTVIFRRTLITQWRIFFKRAWVVGVLFLLLVASLLGADLFLFFMKKIFSIFGSPRDYTEAMLKIIAAIALFNLTTPFFARLKIPRKANYYGSSAVVLIAVGLFIAAVFDITFIPIFLWAFVFGFLAAVIRRPILVFICTLLTPIQVIGALINIMTTGNSQLAQIIASVNFYITLYIAVISLPVLLLFSRAILLSRRLSHLQTAKKYTYFRLSFLGAAILAIVGYNIYLSLNTPLPPDRPVITEQSSADAIMTVSAGDIQFLDRRTVNLRLEAAGSPVQFNVILKNTVEGLPLVIYDTAMPYRISDDGNSVIFLLGEFPENPFSSEIVLPLDFRGILRAEALYTPWDGTVTPEPPENPGDYVLRVVREVPVPPEL
ncbi:hypothetical protein [Breznakiella homolactica]|uniref:Uncharacterized protein n=1 Tax=Breznakiella homolactica TaxID=2798577 RepID=A0A7T8B9Q9_9SPIR|nr:hypothetical protein [Breznakiella homolactica]QQO08210.1 hypothetical protein JFL75_14895 [Breznakiella homolactica]